MSAEEKAPACPPPLRWATLLKALLEAYVWVKMVSKTSCHQMLLAALQNIAMAWGIIMRLLTYLMKPARHALDASVPAAAAKKLLKIRQNQCSSLSDVQNGLVTA